MAVLLPRCRAGTVRTGNRHWRELGARDVEETCGRPATFMICGEQENPGGRLNQVGESILHSEDCTRFDWK
jgi:hypothetical protein